MTNEEALHNLLFCKCEVSSSEFVAYLKHDTVRLAITALAKQTSKKPFHHFEGDDEEWYDCPTCGRALSLGLKKIIDHKYEYCSCCGQKINWSE